MRLQELILIHYAVGHLVQAAYPDGAPAIANLGAIFAHHLVDLKGKALSKVKKVKKFETVGSLLTPIFLHCGVDVSTSSVITTPAFIGGDYLRSTRILRYEREYVFRQNRDLYITPLPRPECSAIDTLEDLGFHPDACYLISPGAGVLQLQLQGRSTRKRSFYLQLAIFLEMPLLVLLLPELSHHCQRFTLLPRFENSCHPHHLPMETLRPCIIGRYVRATNIHLSSAASGIA